MSAAKRKSEQNRESNNDEFRKEASGRCWGPHCLVKELGFILNALEKRWRTLIKIVTNADLCS